MAVSHTDLPVHDDITFGAPCSCLGQGTYITYDINVNIFLVIVMWLPSPQERRKGGVDVPGLLPAKKRL